MVTVQAPLAHVPEKAPVPSLQSVTSVPPQAMLAEASAPVWLKSKFSSLPVVTALEY